MLTGGGTGGHAYPALSIAEAIRAEHPECELLYIGSKDGPEARLAAEAEIEFVGIRSRGLSRGISIGALVSVLSLAGGLGTASSVLRRFNPEVVIGTGGHAAAAVVLAQVLRRGRALILEPDAIPGRTNLWLSRFVDRICVQIPDAIEYFPSEKTVVTGMPIRAGLADLPDKSEARIGLGLRPDAFTLLVLGGSQGARQLNLTVAGAVPMLRDRDIQILHQSGAKNIEEAEASRREIGWDGYHVRAYIDDMRSAYASANLIVSRSGASTIAEITAVGRAAIYVPYPYAHADHQRYNAEYVAKSGGGDVVAESELSPEKLAGMVKGFLERPDELNLMAKMAKSLGRPNAAADIANLALEWGKCENQT